jgi:hypothetical protein
MIIIAVLFYVALGIFVVWMITEWNSPSDKPKESDNTAKSNTTESTTNSSSGDSPSKSVCVIGGGCGLLIVLL